MKHSFYNIGNLAAGLLLAAGGGAELFSQTIFLKPDEIQEVAAAPQGSYAYFGPEGSSIVNDLPLIKKNLKKDLSVPNLDLLCELIEQGKTTAPVKMVEFALQEAAECLAPAYTALPEQEILTIAGRLEDYYKKFEKGEFDLMLALPHGSTSSPRLGSDLVADENRPRAGGGEKNDQDSLILSLSKDEADTATNLTRKIDDRTSKTFRNIDVIRNINTRYLSVARNAVIVGNLTVGGNQTIDGNLTVTGTINGNSGGGTGNFVVNGGQAGPVTIGPNDGISPLTFIGLQTSSPSDNALFIDPVTGVVSEGPGGTGDIINGGQAGPLLIGTNNFTTLTLEADNHQSFIIHETGAISMPGVASGDSLTITSGTNGNGLTLVQSANSGTGSALVVTASTVAADSSPAVMLIGVANSSDAAIMNIAGAAGAGSTGLNIDVSQTASTAFGLEVSGNENEPAVVITDNGGGALRLSDLPATGTGTDSVLSIDSSGDVHRSTLTVSEFVINGGQTGPVTVGTTDATTSLNFTTNNSLNPPRMTIDSAGDVTINTPDSGTALTVTGFAGNGNAIAITQGNDPSAGSALFVQASPNVNAASLTVNGAAGAAHIMDILGGANGNGTGLNIDVSGSNSGIGLTVTGNLASPAVQLTAGTGQTPLVLTGLPASATTDFILSVDNSTGNVNKSAIALSSVVINGGQATGAAVKVGTLDANELDLVTGTSGPHTRLFIDSTGQVTINAPSVNQTTLTLNQSDGGNALIVNALGIQPAVDIIGADSSAGGAALLAITAGSASQSTGLSIGVSSGTGVGLTVDGNTSNPAVVLSGSGSTGPLQLINVQSGTPVVGGVFLSLDASNNVITASIVSSKRFKENFRTLEDSSGIYKLKPTIFDLKPAYGGEKDQIGFLAEEVKEIFPTMINHDKDGKVHSIRYDCFPALLVKELQEHRKELDACEERLQAQGALIENLLTKITELKK